MQMLAYIMAYMIVIFGTINLVRMAFFMVGSDLYEVRMARMRKRIDTYELPTFTVIIPAHNEKNTIRNSIMSVIHANYDRHKLQVIIADDGSTDTTVQVVQECIAENPECDIQLISRPNAGKAHALNNAMRTWTRGELVMCLDADSSLDANALINAARYFTDPNVVALSANVKIRPDGTLLNLVQIFEYLVCYQMKRAQTFFNIEYIIGGIGSTFRHGALKNVDYYDTDTITEDIDLTMKFLQLGNKHHRVIYGSDVIAFTEGVLSISGLIRQRFRWKWGRGQTFEKNWSMFFAPSEKHTRLLTWVYLPYALFGDFVFFFEPFLLTYIFYVIVRYADFATLASAFLVVGSYIFLNVLAENTIPWKQKIHLLVLAPSMYFFFYILSFVEYVALIKTYTGYSRLRKSIGENVCGWEHVERASV